MTDFRKLDGNFHVQTPTLQSLKEKEFKTQEDRIIYLENELFKTKEELLQLKKSIIMRIFTKG